MDSIKFVLAANQEVLPFTVLLYTNATHGKSSGRTVYNVQMSSVTNARRIPELFSGFFRRQNPVRQPSGLANMSLRNKVTFETRVRIAILRQLGENYNLHPQGI